MLLLIILSGHIQAQREKIVSLQNALQDELLVSQNRIAEQEKEIKCKN